MLRGENTGVEKDEDDDQPVEPLRLDHPPTHLGAPSIQLFQPQPVNNRKSFQFLIN